MNPTEEPGRTSLTLPSQTIRTAVVSTRRQALLFPSSGIDANGRPTKRRLARAIVAIRYRIRLAWTRLRFHIRLHGLAPSPVGLAEIRMRARLAFLRLRYRNRLRP